VHTPTQSCSPNGWGRADCRRRSTRTTSATAVSGASSTETPTAAYGFHGVFHGTPSIDGIVQTFEFEGAPGHVSLEALAFEDLGNGRTRLRASAVHQSVEARDAMIESGMESGVNEGYERLDELLTSMAPARS